MEHSKRKYNFYNNPFNEWSFKAVTRTKTRTKGSFMEYYKTGLEMFLENEILKTEKEKYNNTSTSTGREKS